MRLTFVLVATALAIGTTALVSYRLWWPALRSKKAALPDEVRALQVQLQQLSELRQSGTLSVEHYEQAKVLVERKLLDALSLPSNGANPPPPAGTKPSRQLVAALCVFILAVAGGGYAWVGAPQAIETGPGSTPLAGPVGEEEAVAANGAASAPHALTQEQVVGMVDQLAKRLKTSPDDSEGWLMLARSYVVLGRHQEAVGAFKQAERLQPDDPNLLADYADALAMSNGRELAGEPAGLIDRALKIDPANLKALALAGTAAFDRKDYKRAVAFWERLLRADSADGTYAQQIRGSIAEARQLAGMPASAASDSARPAGGMTAGQVGGTASLAPGLRSRVAPDDTVFIFAREAGGASMPLAVLRKQVKDLPLSFTLDDSMAMSADARLSAVARVNVSARVSKSGNAAPQKGDLQGSVSGVAVGTRDIELQITQEVVQ